MSTTMAEGPSEVEWDTHREQLTRLYIEEQKPLRQVMSLMADHHGFVAKKNQYEKYLHHKWRLRKKSTAQIWKAIAPIIHDLDRRGQSYEIWINNEKKSAQTIRKEARRYIHSGKEDGGSTCSLLLSENQQHRLGSPTKLPRGVVIREVCHRQPRQVINLPFQSFERYLGENRPIVEARREFSYSRIARYTELASAQPLVTRRIALHRLKVATLAGGDSRPCQDSPYRIDDSGVFSSSLHRDVMFCLANNYMDESILQSPGAVKILHHEIGKAIFESSCSVISYHSFQAIATNLFQSYVWTGDAKLVDFLLSRSIPGITANKICLYSESWRTDPLTVAAMRCHKDLIKVLLKHGAKVNPRSFERTSSMYNSDSPGNNALDSYILGCLLGQKGEQNLDLEIVELLMSNGAKLDAGSFRQMIQRDKNGRSVSLLLSKTAMSQHKIWRSQRVYHEIFRCQPRDVMLQALETLLRYNIGLNEGIKETQRMSYYPGSTPRDACLLDVVALRGDLEILMMLLKAGAQMTKITLIRAIQSQCEPLVRWMLSQESILECMDSTWDLAISAAIEGGNTQILDGLDSFRHNITKPSKSALITAARAGNWKLFQQFYELHLTAAKEALANDSRNMGACDYSLEIALACCIRDGQDSIASELLDAGVCATYVHDGESDEHLNSYYCLPGTSGPRKEQLPLTEALKKQNIPMVEALLDAGAIHDYQGPIHGYQRYRYSDEPLLLYAIEWGYLPIIRKLIDAGLKLDCPSNRHALNAVVKRKNTDMLEYLLGAGVPINFPNDNSVNVPWTRTRTVLETAVRTNDSSIVRYVLQKGADLRDPGAFASAFIGTSVILDLLLQRFAINCPSGCKGWGGDILNHAIYASNIKIFRQITQAGADANALFIPSYRYDSNDPFKRDKLPHGNGIIDFDNTSQIENNTTTDDDDPISDTDVSDHPLMSSFGYAIIKSPEVGTAYVEYLLQENRTTCCHPESVVSEISIHESSGSDNPDVLRLERRTAFIVAISTAHIPVIEVFIHHNAEINFPAKLNFKRTPLQMAVQSGSLEVVDLLIRHGADVNAPAAQRAGATALQLAALKGYIRITVLLLEHGADVHAPASKVDGRTALEAAAEHGRLDTVALLLQHYGPYGIEHELEFARAMRYAKDNGFDYIVDLIEQYKARYFPVFDEFLNLESFED